MATQLAPIVQELMTPQEAARWFRRSPSWIRQQRTLLRVGNPGGQPLFHTHVCRAYVLGRICGLRAADLRRVQIEALAAACGLDDPQPLMRYLSDETLAEPEVEAPPECCAEAVCE